MVMIRAAAAAEHAHRRERAPQGGVAAAEVTAQAPPHGSGRHLLEGPVRGGGGLYSTAPDYSRLLRCLLRGGELDGVRILSERSVAEITRNQIGNLEAGMQRTALADRSNDFIFMDGSQKFGLGAFAGLGQGLAHMRENLGAHGR